MNGYSLPILLPVGGPSTYNVSVDEAASAADVVAYPIVTASLSEAAAAGDGAANSMTRAGAVSEAASAADALAESSGLSIAEAAGSCYDPGELVYYRANSITPPQSALSINSGGKAFTVVQDIDFTGSVGGFGQDGTGFYYEESAGDKFQIRLAASNPSYSGEGYVQLHSTAGGGGSRIFSFPYQGAGPHRYVATCDWTADPSNPWRVWCDQIELSLAPILSTSIAGKTLGTGDIQVASLALGNSVADLRGGCCLPMFYNYAMTPDQVRAVSAPAVRDTRTSIMVGGQSVLTEAVLSAESLATGLVGVGAVVEAANAADAVTAPGSTYNATLSEAATVSESLAASNVILIGHAEAASAGDAVTGTRVVIDGTTEAAAAGDAVQGERVLPESMTEAANALESLSPTYAAFAAVSEAAAAGEAVSAITLFNAPLDEVVTAGDSLIVIGSVGVSITESASGLDILASSLDGVDAMTEAVNADASLLPELVIDMALSETAAAGESVAGERVIDKTLNEAATADASLVVIVTFGPELLEVANAQATLANSLEAVASLTAAATAGAVIGSWTFSPSFEAPPDSMERPQELRGITRAGEGRAMESAPEARGMERPPEARGAEIEAEPPMVRGPENRGMTR